MDKKKKILGVILLVTVLIGLLNPLQLSLNQQLLTSALIFAVSCWATDAIHKSLACLVLLVATFLFGSTPIEQIISFTYSDTNLLIMTTTLLSVALLKSHMIYEAVAYLFKKASNHSIALLVLPYLLGIVLIFLIPQAFARVIIIGTILDGLLQERTPKEKEAKSALIFNAFIGISIAYMLFSNGDVVLNLSAIKFAGEDIAQHLQFNQWFIMMSVPVILTAVTTLFVTKFVFKEQLNQFNIEMIGQPSEYKRVLTKNQELIALSTMAIILIGWMSQQMHHVPAWLIAALGVGVMLVCRILTVSDFKSINVHFIFFLMTVFNIGKILGQSGVTDIIFNHLKQLIPQQNSLFLIVMIIVIVMILHLCIGSSVATMSVVFPIILPLMQSLNYQGSVIVLMIYVIVNIHFMLPFHHAVMLMGIGKKYYPEQYLMKYGTVMTIVTPLLLLCVYFSWWSFLGIK